MDRHTVLITGAAGYVGAMLVDRLAKRDDVAQVLGIDKDRIPDLIRKEPKLKYFNTNTADDWEKEVREHHPDIIIHAAWQIRELYGAQDMEWDWNVRGSEKVFEYAFAEPEVKRLIHFSTVASYGAFPDNTINHRFTEEEPFRQTDYRYAEEKRAAEERLKAKYDASAHKPMVAVLRPAAITGPRGRYVRVRFGLQSALAGQLKGGIYSLVSALVAFVPVTPAWARQFIHEDDIAGIVERLAFGDALPSGYEAFNLCPPGDVVRGADMAKAVGKRVLPVAPWMVRSAFCIFWHATRGKIPTGRGAWKSYSYPIVVDGAKLTRMTGYQYRYAGLDAFRYTDGVYESSVPEGARTHK